jgi:hypothetical protein
VQVGVCSNWYDTLRSRQSAMLSHWLGAADAIRSIETAQLHRTARRRSGMAARGTRAAACDAGHCAALVAIDRNSWSRSIGMSGRDCRNAQLFSGIGFHQELRPIRCVKICRC